jgi:flagellin
MAQYVNTNISSLNTQRALNQSQGALQTSLQRLSSGLRINSAKDDAAGLVISEKMTGQIRGMNQAMRNANDGISMSQMAEGAMSESTKILQRIRELAVQSANATNSDTDRASLNSEVTQLTSELDRIASTAAFNGIKILDGTFTSQSFQVGANVGETITVASIASGRTDDIGQTNEATAVGSTVQAITTGQLTVNGNAVAATAGDAALIATAISATSGAVTATATNSATIAFGDSIGTAVAPATPGASGASGVFTDADADGTGTEVYSLTVDGVAIFSETAADASSTVTAAEVQSGVDAAVAATGAGSLAAAGITVTGDVASNNLVFTKADGTDFDIVVVSSFNTTPGAFAGGDFAAGTNTVTAGTPAVGGIAPSYTLSVDGTALDLSTAGSDGTVSAAEVSTLVNALEGYTSTETGGNITITKADGSNIVLVEAGSDSDGAEGLAGGAGSAGVTSTSIGSVSVTSVGEALVIGGTSASNAGLASGTTATSQTGVTIADTTVATFAGANAAITSVDAALATISGTRSELGALQSRFDSTIANLASNVENLSSARSRIRDTDFAVETAELTRVQILQQAGVAMLSQANSAPQSVLALLQ